MRLYKPTFSKPLPKEAEAFVCKSGRHKGRQFVKFKDSRGRTTEARLTKNGDKILIETSHWHISFEDNLSITRELKAYTNEAASNTLADRIKEMLYCQVNRQVTSQELQRFLEAVPSRIMSKLIEFGVLDRERLAAVKPLTEHIEDYYASLTAQERTPGHIRTTISNLRRLCRDCGFVTWSDISAEQLETYLADRRRTKKHFGYRTSNMYLKSLKSFCRWMIVNKRASRSPVQYLKLLDEELDRRHIRRPLELDEVRRLLETTAAGPERFGMSGQQRYWVYRLATETGLRRGEIKSLTVGSFDFEQRTVTVKATASKRRKEDTLSLKRVTATELKAYFTDRAPTDTAFGLWRNMAEVMREDLEAAGIEYVDSAGRVVDFHSLRHSTASLLAASGVQPKVVQELMRHSDINLTMNAYAHTLRGQQTEAVEHLPDLSAVAESQELAATGTEGGGDSLPPACFSPVQQKTTMTIMDSSSAIDGTKTQLRKDDAGAGLTNCQNTASNRTQKTSLRRSKPAISAAPQKQLVSGLFSDSKSDPQLAQIIKVWPDLPKHIKAAIKALIQTHITEKK